MSAQCYEKFIDIPQTIVRKTYEFHQTMTNTNMFTPPNRSGMVFRSGKLYRFEKNRSIEVIRSWPDVCGWRKTRRGGWRHFRPKIVVIPGQINRKLSRLSRPDKEDPQLVFPWAVQREHASRVAYLQWLLEIPEEVRRQVVGFSQRQYHMIKK